MKKILVSTTYSDNPLNTWRYALKLALYYDAEITLLDVCDEDATASEQEQIKDGYLEFIRENTPKQFHSITIKSILIAGGISKSILEEEQKNNYDLLILGTKKRKNITDLLFGNITKQIIQKSKTTIMFIPTTAQYQGINKMVYISNFVFSDLGIIRKLGEWVEVFKTKLDIIHVYKNGADFNAVKDNMDNFMEYFSEEIESETYFFHMMKDTPSKSINDYIKMNHTNMIVMTYRERGFLSRIKDADFTENISSDSLVPVLIFKD